MANKHAGVTTKVIALSEIEDAPYNPRAISESARAGLRESLQRFGLMDLPVVNRLPSALYRLVSGHMRMHVLREEGVKEVCCIVVDLDPVQERRGNVALNNRAIQGEWVPEMVQALLTELKTADADQFAALRLDTLSQQTAKSLRVPKVQATPLASDLTALDVAASPASSISKTAADSRAGLMYALGPHLIRCSDSIKTPDVSAFGTTSPTCGVTSLSAGRLSDAYVAGVIQALLAAVIGPVYVVMSPSDMIKVQAAFVAAGGHHIQTLLWYARAGEPAAQAGVVPVLYGWSRQKPPLWKGPAQSNVAVLPTVPKAGVVPVSLFGALLQASTKTGDVVYDPAVRAPTVLAAAKLGRVLWGQCAQPRDLDAIRRRYTAVIEGDDKNWLQATGVPREK